MPKKIDLNAPAFGPGAQKADEVVVAPVVTEEAKAEEEVKPEAAVVAEVAPVVEEKPNTVKYSRFKQWHDRALEAEREAEQWRLRATSSMGQSAPATESANSEVPSYWLELYGNSEASVKAWQVQAKANESFIQQAQQKALEVVENQRYAEADRIDENVAELDNGFEDLEALVGRELSDTEQSALLDIVDDYTPKDRNGDYLGAIMPFEKAWEVYELRQAAGKAPKIKARDSVAGLSGKATQGEVSITERDKNFNPLDWNAWRNRI